MNQIALERSTVSDGQLLAHGLISGGPIQISLHSSARMKLLGNGLGDLDPLEPKTEARIARAAARILEVDTVQRDGIVITALDLD
ncbi:hypothetical protein [Sphingomonas sp.]|uniref:hypothetical protein n=1 Tax=Sphingomonas sp. TaxID=28214 RepID=UPI002FD91CE2